MVTLGAKEAGDLHAVRPPRAQPPAKPLSPSPSATAPALTPSASRALQPQPSPATNPRHPPPQVVQFLRSQNRTANLALWGRSMGATTSLIYASQNLSIAGLVLDSPFSRLTDLIQDIVRDMTGGRAPSWLARDPRATPHHLSGGGAPASPPRLNPNVPRRARARRRRRR